MALPPEPLDEILPGAAAVVVARVADVADLGAWPPAGARYPVDGAPELPAQRVHLSITRVLRGAARAGAVVVARKPAGAYALRVGVVGAFLLDLDGAGNGEPTILGRYGPDTWAVDDVERAMTSGSAR